MFERNLVENVSRHGGYREVGEAIWLRPESRRVTIGEEKLHENSFSVNNPINSGPTVFYVDERKRALKKKEKGEISNYELSLSGWGPEHVEQYKAVVEEQVRSKKEGR